MSLVIPDLLSAAVKTLDNSAARINFGHAAALNNARRFIGLLCRSNVAPAAARYIATKEDSGQTTGWRIQFVTTTGGFRVFQRRATTACQYSSTGDVVPADGVWRWIGVYMSLNEANLDKIQVYSSIYERGTPQRVAMTVNSEGSGTISTDVAEDLCLFNDSAAFTHGAPLEVALASVFFPTTFNLNNFREWIKDPLNYCLGNPALLAFPGLDGAGKVTDWSGKAQHGTLTLSTGSLVQGPNALGSSYRRRSYAAAGGGNQIISAGVASASASVPGATLTTAAISLVAGTPAVTASAPAAVLSRRTLPLMDMGAYTYWGRSGLLYPGSNTMPTNHRTALMAAAALVVRRDSAGTPSPTGKIVLLAEGPSLMSQCWQNTQQTGSPAGSTNAWTLMGIAAADGEVDHVGLVILNGAFAGNGNSRWDSSSDPDYASQVTDILTPAGIDPNQVQVVCFKAVNGNPSVSLPTAGSDYDNQVTELGNIIRAIRIKFPNCKIIYLASRTYGGYAITGLSPEPYAYEGGFSVKEIIQAQIDQMNNGGTIVDSRAGNLDYTGGACPVVAWGPYFWADGLTPRSDGVTWDIADFEVGDRTHEDTPGETKIANMWLAFLKTERSASTWFLTDQVITPGVASASASVPSASLGTGAAPLVGGVANVTASAPAAIITVGPATITAGVASVSVTAPAASLVLGSAPQTIVAGVPAVSATVPVAVFHGAGVALMIAGVATATATAPSANVVFVDPGGPDAGYTVAWSGNTRFYLTWTGDERYLLSFRG